MEEIIQKEINEVENTAKTKRRIPKNVIVIGIILIAIILTITAYSLTEYIKNKTFHNGICGDYVCVDVSVPYTNKTVKKKTVQEVFLGMECDVDSSGTVSGIFKNRDFKLFYNGDFGDFFCSPWYNSIPYYARKGNQPNDMYVTNVDYSKASRDSSIEDDHLSFQFLYEGESFFVNFEKVDD